MSAIIERVLIGQERLTVVIPLTKREVILNKMKKMRDGSFSFEAFERLVVINGGYIRDTF